MNASASGNASNGHVRWIASPLRGHYGTSTSRFAFSASESLSRAIAPPRPRKAAAGKRLSHLCGSTEEDLALAVFARRDPVPVDRAETRPAVRALHLEDRRGLDDR